MIKNLLIVITFFLQMAVLSQNVQIKGGYFFCPDEPFELKVTGDTITNWAYAIEPDSIISTDWIFSDVINYPTSYLLYTSTDTTLIEMKHGKSLCFCQYYIPNRFTPDGDAYNGKFIPIINCNHTTIRMTIYSREQLIVYDEQGLYLAWDGTNPGTGIPMQQGVYAYIISFLTEDGEKITTEGHITLSR